jgi:type IV secretion system protein VirD4
MKNMTIMFLGVNTDGSFRDTDSYQHAILFAPTGSGKGVSYVLPNLLYCEDSIICHDIKGENYQLTSKYRESIGQKVFFWNPLDLKTHKYNPFDAIDIKNKNTLYSDISKIAHILINGSCTKSASVRRLFIDTAINIIGKNNKVSFGDILKEIKSNGGDNEVALNLMSYLELWNNPLIDNATSSSDFDIRNFRDEKSTLYVVIDSNEMNRLQPLMNFIYQHFIDLLTSKPHQEIKDKGGVRLFLDEFSTLGRMPEFEIGVAYLRGYRVGLFLTVQNLPQLQAVYKENTTSIVNNMSFRISFHTNDFETADFISKLCLNKEGFDWKDLMQLKNNEQIVFNESEEPQKYKKFKYFDDEEFKKKINL